MFIKDNGQKEKKMVKEKWSIQMAMNIRESGLMIKNKDMEFINGLMAMFLREIGREII